MHVCVCMCLLRREDVGVSLVSDRDHGYAEELSTRSAEVTVGAGVVVHSALGEHGVVLDLGLAQRRAVGGDDHELGLGVAKSLVGERGVSE
jgi:hypothetical protein